MYLRRNSKTKMEVSIDEPLNVDWDGNELLLSDILGTDEDVIYKDIEAEVEHHLLGKAIEKLSGRERLIVELRYGLGKGGGKELTQKEVADKLGISQSYISRLEKKIMRRLKKEMIRLGGRYFKNRRHFLDGRKCKTIFCKTIFQSGLLSRPVRQSGRKIEEIWFCFFACFCEIL